jgi:hypothetical protein
VPDLAQTLEERASRAAPRRAGSRRRARPPRRRRGRRVLLVLVLLAVLGLAAVAVALARTASSVNAEAAEARTALDRVRAALAAGDVPSARDAQAEAARHVAAATAEADSWPVGVLRRVPVAGSAATDLDHLLTAAGLVVRSSGELVTAYDQVTGGGAPLLQRGRVDLDRLPALEERLGAAAAPLRAAERELRRVDAELPGLGRVAATRDGTLRDVVPARRALDHAVAVLDRLPAALGADRPMRYLLAISNESELRASGGAPLSVAVLTFDDGAISVSESVQAEDLPERLTWRGEPGSPFNDPDGRRTDRFANASFHPDFRTAARDLLGAARAAGFPRMSGVVSVDVRAVAEVLRVTGPLDSSAYGQVTAGNVGQKLLVEAYATYKDDQDIRQGLNDELRDALIVRLLSGQAVVPVMRALGGSTAGRHVQVYTDDPALEDEIVALGAGGAIRDDAPDLVGVFSQNGNGSKVDVFQRRAVRVDVRLAADGSAEVRQTVQVHNDVPEDRAARRARSGYLTGWSRNAYFVYLPGGATDPELSSATQGFAVVPFDDRTWADDGRGHRLGRVVGELAPGAEGELTLSYRLPAGTFRTASGDLRYAVRALPQPLWSPAELVVSVTGPGVSAERRVVLDRDRTVTVPAGGGDGGP